jgi:hypothetical protein
MLACGAAHYSLSCGCVVYLSCLCEAEILLRLTLERLFLSLTRVAVTTMGRIFLSSGNCVLSSIGLVDCELTDVISCTGVLSSWVCDGVTRELLFDETISVSGWTVKHWLYAFKIIAFQQQEQIRLRALKVLLSLWVWIYYIPESLHTDIG